VNTGATRVSHEAAHSNFWLGELESDIRRDPETAFHEEQERLARRAEENIAGITTNITFKLTKPEGEAVDIIFK
jgi:hypothetical protein